MNTLSDLRLRLAIVLAIIFIIFILAIYFLGYFPSFLTLPVDFPEDDLGDSTQYSTTYSVLNQFGIVFTWRKHGFVGYVSADRSEKLKTIVDYYTHRLGELGWAASDNTDICDKYLTEAHLLVEHQDGVMLQYMEKGSPVYVTGDYFGDLICTSIIDTDPNEDSPYTVFSITIFTARQSLIKVMLDSWSVLNY